MMNKITKVIYLFCLLLCPLTAKTQNRNTVVKALNNYVLYSNANITALSIALNTLDRYNGLFNDYLRKDRKLGGETYEKPKSSPFLDEDVFTMNVDNPDYLYAVALKGSVALPVSIQKELNKTMKSMRDCSLETVRILDSLSNIFSGPMISVTNDPEALPFCLLYEAKWQLQLSKKHRDQLFMSLRNYYIKACPLKAPKNDYIHSIDPLKNGMEYCQNMMNDLSMNDSSHIAQYVQSLDSLLPYLERSELTLLKGIRPYGNSRHFPNKGYRDGFDLYSKYEDLIDEFRFFSNSGKKFMNEPITTPYPTGKCYYYHQEVATKFNGALGLLYDYNEYVLLIGGGKMKLRSEGVGSSRHIYKGWGDESHSLPLRSILCWMKETPGFEIEH